MNLPKIDFNSWFYKNCKRQRKNNAKICQCCPFKKGIEEQERQYYGCKHPYTDYEIGSGGPIHCGVCGKKLG